MNYTELRNQKFNDIMNKNALKNPSKVKVKTQTGKLADGFGHSKVDGLTMTDEEYFQQLGDNGYKIEIIGGARFISKT